MERRRALERSQEVLEILQRELEKGGLVASARKPSAEGVGELKNIEAYGDGEDARLHAGDDAARFDGLYAALETARKKQQAAEARAEALEEDKRRLEREKNALVASQEVKEREQRERRMQRVVYRLMNRGIEKSFNKWCDVVEARAGVDQAKLDGLYAALETSREKQLAAEARAGALEEDKRRLEREMKALNAGHDVQQKEQRENERRGAMMEQVAGSFSGHSEDMATRIPDARSDDKARAQPCPSSTARDSHIMLSSTGGINFYNYTCKACSRTLQGKRWYCAKCHEDYCFSCCPEEVQKREQSHSDAGGRQRQLLSTVGSDSVDMQLVFEVPIRGACPGHHQEPALSPAVEYCPVGRGELPRAEAIMMERRDRKAARGLLQALLPRVRLQSAWIVWCSRLKPAQQRVTLASSESGGDISDGELDRLRLEQEAAEWAARAAALDQIDQIEPLERKQPSGTEQSPRGPRVDQLGGPPVLPRGSLRSESLSPRTNKSPLKAKGAGSPSAADEVASPRFHPSPTVSADITFAGKSTPRVSKVDNVSPSDSQDARCQEERGMR